MLSIECLILDMLIFLIDRVVTDLFNALDWIDVLLIFNFFYTLPDLPIEFPSELSESWDLVSLAPFLVKSFVLLIRFGTGLISSIFSTASGVLDIDYSVLSFDGSSGVGSDSRSLLDDGPLLEMNITGSSSSSSS